MMRETADSGSLASNVTRAAVATPPLERRQAVVMGITAL